MATRQEALETAAKECLELTVMAYIGNVDERQALRMIRSRLMPFFSDSKEPA
jgi:hypothetical protein